MDPVFNLFGFVHISFMIFIIICWILTIVVFNKVKNEKARLTFRIVLSSLLFIGEVIRIIRFLATDQMSLEEVLPLHLCAVLTYLSIIMLITKNKTLYDIVYFLGIGGAIQPIITPDTIAMSSKMMFFQSLTVHGAIILAALYMTFVEKFRPKFISLIKVFVVVNLYLILVYFINLLIGGDANYMFLMRAEKGTIIEVIESKIGNPWYIIGLELIGLITITLLYIPWAIKYLIAEKNSTKFKRKYLIEFIITIFVFIISSFSFALILLI